MLVRLKKNWWWIMGVLLIIAVLFYIFFVAGDGSGSGHGQLGEVFTTK